MRAPEPAHRERPAQAVGVRGLRGREGGELRRLPGVHPAVQPHLPALLAAFALGCAGATPAAAPPEEGLPLIIPPSPPHVAALPEPEPTPPDDAGAPCPLQWSPRPLHFSVFSLPAEHHGRMMLPLYRALCACTRPGQSLLLVLHAVPERGELHAQTADRPELRAHPSRSIDACLAEHLDATRFEPFAVGSDVFCDPPPTRPPARVPGEPAHFTPPRRVGCVPEEEKRSQLILSLHVDRRAE